MLKAINCIACVVEVCEICIPDGLLDGEKKPGNTCRTDAKKSTNFYKPSASLAGNLCGLSFAS